MMDENDALRLLRLVLMLDRQHQAGLQRAAAQQAAALERRRRPKVQHEEPDDDDVEYVPRRRPRDPSPSPYCEAPTQWGLDRHCGSNDEQMFALKAWLWNK